MTEREKQIFDIIKANPAIGQSELAGMLNIARSSVAVHIANLQKKGCILGKGYIVKSHDYVVGVGAANVDVHGKSRAAIVLHDSNPGHMHTSAGGVTRNVLENLARLGEDAKLITATGDDVYGHKIRVDSENAGVDMTNIFVAEGRTSSTYISVLDDNGDMFVALSDMSVLNCLPAEFLRQKLPLINGAKLVTTDPSLPPPVMKLLLDSAQVPVFVDPVSTAYARVIKEQIGRFHTIKPNRLEAEILSDTKITDEKSLDRACGVLLDKGVRRVIVSLGADGCYFKSADGETLHVKLKPFSKVENATGAGDAFMAAVIYCTIHDISGADMLEFASAAAAVAIQSENTINPDMSVQLVTEVLNKRRA